MKKSDFLLKLRKLLELKDDEVISGEESLNDLPAWDSLAVLGFITLVDKEFGISLMPSNIAEAQKIDDLIELLGEKVQ